MPAASPLARPHRPHALLALAVLVAACARGPVGPAERGNVDLRVRASVADPELSTLVVRVTAADLSSALLFNLDFVNGTASGTVGVPAGPDRTITVSAYDAVGIETHRGQATTDVAAGSNPPLVITLLPVSGSQPIDVVVGDVFVDVTPDTLPLAAGSTGRLTASITDASGSPVDGSPVWATTDPSVATVDTDGLVTAVAAGSAQILASFGGVGDVAEILVTGAAP